MLCLCLVVWIAMKTSLTRFIWMRFVNFCMKTWKQICSQDKQVLTEYFFVKFLFKDRICRNRPESASSTKADPRQWSPQEQLQGNDHWEGRPKPETSGGHSPSKGSLWEQSQARDICVSRPKAVTSPGAGTNDWPLRKQALAGDLWTGRHTTTFEGSGLS